MQRLQTLRRFLLNSHERLLGHFESIVPPETASHLRTGVCGERVALFELRRRGFTIVAQRWTSTRSRGDLDLIAWDGPSLCFIEVKTRTSRDFQPAEAAVDEHKRSMIRKLARIYLKSFPERQRATIPVRFDVVSVYALERQTDFELFPSAFGWR